jgi:hypothetical protein
MLAALAPLAAAPPAAPSTEPPAGGDVTAPDDEENAPDEAARAAAAAEAAEAAAKEEDRRKLVAFATTMGEFMAVASEGVRQLGQVRSLRVHKLGLSQYLMLYMSPAGRNHLSAESWMGGENHSRRLIMWGGAAWTSGLVTILALLPL